MKKTLCYLAFLFALTTANAQVIWLEDFNDLNISDWTLYDEDGDGNNWYRHTLPEYDSPFLTSSSGFFAPDNWAVSPAIDLTDFANHEIELAWKIFTSEPNQRTDHYEVFVGTSNNVGDFLAAGDLFNEEELPNQPTERTLDLSSFAGQTIYVAFRHFAPDGDWRAAIDDVSVKALGSSDTYCVVEISNEVQPITKVNFAGIDHTSDLPDNGNVAHEYFLDVQGDVLTSETYEIKLEGNTFGNNTNSFSAFIDWNHNDLFEPNERYSIGSITNSTGADGQQATAEITVPALAVLGETRMRIIKTAGSEAPTDACGTYEFGQVEDYTLNVAKGNGCLEAGNGQYPTLDFIPDCVGFYEIVTDEALTGEYSIVQVTSGMTYTFGTSDETLYITIGNVQGTEVLASGTGMVTWTSDFDGRIRFYSHLDSDCGYIPLVEIPSMHVRFMKCGEPTPEPEYGCNQEYVGPFSVASSVSSHLGYDIANDFFVPMDAEQYKINSVTLLLLPIGGQNDFSTFDLKILNDNEGTPGSVEESFTNLTPTSIAPSGELFGGYDTYYVTFDLNEFELPVNPESDSRYWLQVTGNSVSDQNIFWAGYVHNMEWATKFNYISNDDGTTWTPVTEMSHQGKYFDSIWSIDANCEELGTSDLNSFDFTYYPNPVKDVLNVFSKKSVENVSVFNLAGQKVLNNAKVSNNQVDVSALISGTYVFKVTLEGGQIETFKIIKK